jgi:hypothetical protein
MNLEEKVFQTQFNFFERIRFGWVDDVSWWVGGISVKHVSSFNGKISRKEANKFHDLNRTIPYILNTIKHHNSQFHHPKLKIEL